MCTMVVKEVISRYMYRDSSVFCTFLDASKAFDKVHYCKLFSLLLSRNIPTLIIRLLLNIYTGQCVRVLWNGIYSGNFSVRNGVKQGGIISPINGKNPGFLQGCKSQCSHTSKTANIKSSYAPHTRLTYSKGL
jgi:hypothetical protein